MIWNIEKSLIAKWHMVVFIAILFAIAQLSMVFAARPLPALNQKLQRKVSVTWQGQQLAAALERLSSAGQIPLWLDRRVDRQQTITMQFLDLPLEQVLEKIARHQSLGFTRLNSIVYLGPHQTALELPPLIHQARDQLAKLPTGVRKRWLRTKSTAWTRLSEPRKLAESWLQEADIRLVGSEQIAHDLWPAQSLPPLALVDRLVLLLAGFDLTCQIGPQGESCEIVPIARPLIARPLKRARRRKVQSGKGTSRQLFTLRLENQPLGKVLDQFARQLQLEVVWALEGKLPRERLISCNVQNVELDDLLRKVLSPAGLRHQRKGKRVTIEAKP